MVGTGLMYYKARYYYPALGRFVSADTIVPEAGNPQVLNRYAYGKNNPLRYVDPSGHIEVNAGDAYRKPYSNYWYTYLNPELTESQGGYQLSSAQVEGAISTAPDLYDVGEATRDLVNAGKMVRGGFELHRGFTYPGQIIVKGSLDAKAAAGLPPRFTHGRSCLPCLRGYTNPWGAATRAVDSPMTVAALGINYSVNTYQYSLGSKRDVGLLSSEYVAAMSTDTVIELGPPAAGAAAGSLFGPVGTVVGGAGGTLAGSLWSIWGRDITVEFVDDNIVSPAAKGWLNYHAMKYQSNPFSYLID